MTTTTQTDAKTDVTDTDQSTSYTFLTAILTKDVVTLRQFGIDDKIALSIDLKTQIDVAHKLLASDNNTKRSQSKRVLAAQAGVTNVKTPDPQPANVIPVKTTPQAVFHQTTKSAQSALKAVS